MTAGRLRRIPISSIVKAVVFYEPALNVNETPAPNRPAGTSGEVFFRMAALALCVAALYLARDVLIPVVAAGLISFLLAPAVRLLERWRMPHVLAVFTTVFVSLSIFLLLATLAGRQFINLVEELPRYEQTFKSRLDVLRSHSPTGVVRAVDILQGIGGETFFSRSSPAGSAPSPDGEQQTAIPVEVQGRRPTLIELLATYVTPALGKMARLGIVAILVVFILLYRRDLRDRLVQLAGQSNTRLTDRALNESGGRVSGYLMMQFVNNVCYGLVVGVGLWLIGLPGAAFWGLAAMVVRFIPYLGPWMGALMPIVLSLGVFGDWMRPALVIAMFIGLEILFNNFIEPYLFGAGAGISPIGVIVSLVFWGWVWGPIGLLLAVPLSACFVVAGHYLPQLRIFPILIGDHEADDLSTPAIHTPAGTTVKTDPANAEPSPGQIETP